MSLPHAILGFLAYRPMSGYDLKKAFDGSVRHFWPADQSQIYRTLAQLAGEGLVERETAGGARHRDRHVYHLTDAGRAELHRWLAAPQPSDGDRVPFLIQVFFAAGLPPADALRVLEEHRAAVRAQYAFYDELFARLVAGDGGAPDERALFFSMLTLEHVLAVGQGYLRWIDAAVDRVRREDYTPRHPDTYPNGDES